MTNVEHATKESSFQDVIRVDKGQVRAHVDELVRASVEQTLNGLLDAEADELCGAARYERSPDRVDTVAASSAVCSSKCSRSAEIRPKNGHIRYGTRLAVAAAPSLPFSHRNPQKEASREPHRFH
jgi:hypothetical protein